MCVVGGAQSVSHFVCALLIYRLVDDVAFNRSESHRAVVSTILTPDV